MVIFPRVGFLIFVFSLPAFAQSTGYSFDNFDTARGVKVGVESTDKNAKRQTRKNQTVLTVMTNAAVKTARQTSNRAQTASLLDPNVATYSSSVGLSINKNSALRGFTTGNAQIDEYMISSGTANGVDPLLLYSIMHQESSFKRNAISPKGARGLMQLMPYTAIRYGVTNIFDPKQNIEGGARYLRFLFDHFDGDIDLVLAGYNAGEGAVEKYGWQIPPYSETQEYVRRISRRYELLRDPNAALYAPRVARAQYKQSAPLAVYERTVLTVRLPDGRLQLMNQ